MKTYQKSVRKPELLIYLPSFTSGGDKNVILLESGKPLTLAKPIREVNLAKPLSAREARKVILYNLAIETQATKTEKSQVRRRLPSSVRSLLYD